VCRPSIKGAIHQCDNCRLQVQEFHKQFMPTPPPKPVYKVWCCSLNRFTNDCKVYKGATDQRH
jgi:hypothetical protein